MANYIGEDSFKHSESDTRNLLKVTDNQNSKSTNTVSVTAYGYAGHPRFDQIPVLGGDGKVHLVTVPWVEYIGVNKTSTMLFKPPVKTAAKKKTPSCNLSGQRP
jgi:hypothetical protein